VRCPRQLAQELAALLRAGKRKKPTFVVSLPDRALGRESGQRSVALGGRADENPQ
jgi:hypothetical protein